MVRAGRHYWPLALLLQGCVLDAASRGDAGAFTVNVECEEGAAVDVELNLDREDSRQRVEKRAIP